MKNRQLQNGLVSIKESSSYLEKEIINEVYKLISINKQKYERAQIINDVYRIKMYIINKGE